jgi:5-methylthioribose kinase
MVMEDLSDHRIWRGELINNVYYPQAASQLGNIWRRRCFTPAISTCIRTRKRRRWRSLLTRRCARSPKICSFNDPYQIHERNNYPAELEADVAALRDDAQLKLAVASLKHRFFSHAEALLHGDIHSGSIFVAEGSLKAIDAEFGYFGPIGFDIGTAIGNLLLNYCGLPGHLGIRDAAAARAAPERYSALWTTFAERFQALAAEKTRDAALAWPGYASAFLKKCGRRGRLLRHRTDSPQRRPVARRGYRHYPGRRHAPRMPAPRHHPG